MSYPDSDGDTDSADIGDAGDDTDTSTPLGDAQPFEYSEDSAGGETVDIAARGVSEAGETECDVNYEVAR